MAAISGESLRPSPPCRLLGMSAGPILRVVQTITTALIKMIMVVMLRGQLSTTIFFKLLIYFLVEEYNLF